jgi:mannose-1-phosphate guanylyltransferase/mannose-6-phosphate isomerase
MKVIILAGGNGTRLWPISRTKYPKQFLKLKNKDESLFQMTFNRSLQLADIDDIYVVTNNDQKFLVSGQIEEMGYKYNEGNILIEPSGKNTLPAIYYAVQEIQIEGEDVVTVFSSDHLIHDEVKFVTTVQEGIQLAQDHIIIFGVRPDSPHTGYGYIKPDNELSTGYKVGEFKEKPSLEIAKTYIENGYLWNSGMFMFRTDIFDFEVEKYSPDVYKAFREESIEVKYERTPDISVDYGIIEKTDRLAVIPLEVKWNDLGSFDTFYDEFDSDEQGNITFGGDMLINAHNNLLYTDKDKAVAVIGADDLIVVDQKDALLICKKDQSQKVKEIVSRLKEKEDDRVDNHLTAYRPWGSYTILEEGIFYKIKRISVLPGKKLSYQFHHHRSEHWIVVKGTAKVTIEGQETLVNSGESTFVNSGFKHRLENPGKVLLEVIEVQLGEYLEEDDIVRLEDDFGREGDNENHE